MLDGIARRTLILVAIAVLAAGCGCGGGAEARSDRPAKLAATEPEKPVNAAAPRGKTVKVVSSQFGRVLADRRGQALYLFAKEKRGRSECYGACARAWPPLLTKGRPRAGSGARARLLGTTRRRDGRRQVTYRGQPLYYYVADAPGRILCHDVDEFGGLWLVVQPNGRPVP